MSKDHERQWIYDGKSCCYRLKCAICAKQTTAHYFNGPMPDIGDPVRFDGDSTIEKIGSALKEARI